MYGVIYRATNLVNCKVWIGQTKQKLSTRINDHWFASKHSEKKWQCRYFMAALRKYSNPKDWEWSVIDVAETKEELDQKEIYWIALYHSYDDHEKGYNLSPGGRGASVTGKGTAAYFRWKAKMDLVAPWRQPKSSLKYQSWHRNCRSTAISTRGLRVQCIELDREFSNLKEAVNWMKSQNLGCGIRWALQNSEHTAGGYHWKRL